MYMYIYGVWTVVIPGEFMCRIRDREGSGGQNPLPPISFLPPLPLPHLSEIYFLNTFLKKIVSIFKWLRIS